MLWRFCRVLAFIHSQRASGKCPLFVRSTCDNYCKQPLWLCCYVGRRKMFALFALKNGSSYEHCILHTFIMYTVIVGMLVVVGIIGNNFTFAVFWKGNFKSSTSFLFMCLSLTDSAVLLTAFMFFSIDHFVEYSGYMQGLLNGYVIIFFAFPVFCIAHTATVWVTVLIAVNRYIIVCRPLKASHSKVKKQFAAVLVSAVLYNVAVFGGMVLCSGRPMYIFLTINLLHTVCLLILPIYILTLLNILLIKALKTHRRMQMQNQSS